MQDQGTTVGGYLLSRLKELGADHIFGVPGDFVLGFLNQALKSGLKYVGTCNELNAAYAADGYARLKGIGVFAATHGVGELSALNGVAGAFAERVPVVVITGSPATANFETRPLLHHTLGDYCIPLNMYEQITAASTMLESGKTAPAEIDRVLAACLACRQPVYISLPADVPMMPCAAPGPFPFPKAAPSDPDALREALAEALKMLGDARKPVVLADVELLRFGLRGEFAAFLERSGFPYATMLLGKTVLPESHPQFIGYFEGARSRDYVLDRVSSADCVLQLGALMTDLNTGGFTLDLDASRTISANIGSVKIKNHVYENVRLEDFLNGLGAGLERKVPGTLETQCAADACVHRPGEPYKPQEGKLITNDRFFDRMSHYLEKDSVVIAETGVALFSAAEVLMPDGAAFLGQTFYGSIGWSVGAAVGAALAAKDRKVVLFVGDGAFQATGQEYSTMIRNGLNIAVFLLNNDGYTTERVISDHPYNDIAPWNYHKLPAVYGDGRGFDVHTEDELERALRAVSAADRAVLIEVHTGRLDCPETLRHLGRALAAANHLD